MILPKTLKIGGFTWKVKRNGDVANQGNVYGSTHYKTQTIFLEPESIITEQNQDETLLHEILHAIILQTGLSVRLDNNDLVEEIVCCLSNGLYQVLKDNKLHF